MEREMMMLITNQTTMAKFFKKNVFADGEKRYTHVVLLLLYIAILMVC